MPNVNVRTEGTTLIITGKSPVGLMPVRVYVDGQLVSNAGAMTDATGAYTYTGTLETGTSPHMIRASWGDRWAKTKEKVSVPTTQEWETEPAEPIT